MKVHRILALLISVLLAGPALSGAWLREKGTRFSSVTASAQVAAKVTQTTYFEYGIRDDLTLGAEVAFATFYDGSQSGSATAFLRRPIRAKGLPGVWAYELGLGAEWSGQILRPFVKTGLSWGRGYQINQLNGWVAVDASVRFDVYFADHTTKIDSTVGLNFSDSFAGMLQIFHAANTDNVTTSIAPSIVLKPLKDKPEIRLQIGGEAQLGQAGNPAINLSLWRDF